MNFVSRFFSSYAIQIRGGEARCVKGTMLSHVIMDISSLAADFGLKDGEIWIDQLGKVSFSSGIPKEIHQRIRNVLFSQ
jgi:hypothetical protein